MEPQPTVPINIQADNKVISLHSEPSLQEFAQKFSQRIDRPANIYQFWECSKRPTPLITDFLYKISLFCPVTANKSRDFLCLKMKNYDRLKKLLKSYLDYNEKHYSNELKYTHFWP